MILQLPNLASQAVTFCAVAPWDMELPIPDGVRKDRKARFNWMTNPETRHCFYSFVEGSNANARILSGKEDTANPVYRIHGLAVDYDAPLSNEEIAAGLKRLAHPVAYIERTLSGYVRLIFQFAEPLNVPGGHAASEFYRVCSDRLKLKMFGPGFDEKAFLDPARYYTNSCDWMVVDPDARLDMPLVRGWFIDAAKKIAWNRAEYGMTVPLEKVAEALALKYPKFREWSDFALGSQGPTFWVEASTSPKSAIVHETGIYTFSQNASKSFYSWSDLLSAQFVDEYRVREQAAASEGIYYDGQSYWLANPDKKWQPWPKDNLTTYLKVTRKVDPARNKITQTSNIERVVNHVNIFQRVDEAAPYVFRPAGLLDLPNGKRVLNICNLRVTTPVEGESRWGKDGNFPWLAKYFDSLLSTTAQKEYLMAWMAHFYRGALTQKPTAGQSVVLVGEAGIGKTLFSRGILSRLMGGCADAACFLTGNDAFGGNLFEVGVWALDDNSYIDSAASWRKMSEKIKAVTANSSHRYNQKFQKGGMVDWQGRVVITANCDEESVQQIPATDISNAEKLSLLRTASKMPFKYPGFWELGIILDREMPHFAAWLRDHEIPLDHAGDSRYGVAAFHEESLLETVHQSSPTYNFYEILHDWAVGWFAHNPGTEAWEGTAHQLQKSILLDESAIPALRNYTVVGIGKALSSLKKSGRYNIDTTKKEGMRYWIIRRPSDLKPAVKPPAGESLPEIRAGSKFDKPL